MSRLLSAVPGANQARATANAMVLLLVRLVACLFDGPRLCAWRPRTARSRRAAMPHAPQQYAACDTAPAAWSVLSGRGYSTCQGLSRVLSTSAPPHPTPVLHTRGTGSRDAAVGAADVLGGAESGCMSGSWWSQRTAGGGYVFRRGRVWRLRSLHPGGGTSRFILDALVLARAGGGVTERQLVGLGEKRGRGGGGLGVANLGVGVVN